MAVLPHEEVEASAEPVTRPADATGVCIHCGLPTASSDERFCCAGCEAVYHALEEAGFGSDYYRLQEVGRIAPTSPARTSVDPLLATEVDSEWFLSERARPMPDGCFSAVLNLEGVHCAACLWLIEQLPYQLDGVRAARLDLARARLAVTWDPSVVRLSEVLRWLARFGYAARPVGSGEEAEDGGRERRLLIKLGVSWALAGNVMLIAFALYAGLETAGGSLAAAARWLSLLLAIPAVLYGGSEFYGKAWRSVGVALRRRSLRPLHMDVPISLGILVGFTHSAYATIAGLSTVWFDSITILIAALLTARWLQERSRKAAGDAAERLLALIPSMARRVSGNGSVEVVRTESLQHDDVVEVPPEEVIPVDGILVSGNSSVNNAVLTGESDPIGVSAGAHVYAGAMNLSATVRVRTQAAGDASRVGRLLAWMNDPYAARAPVVMLADRIGGYFVAGVVLLAVFTAVLWLYLDPSSVAAHVAALLVITCPCALGMATPLAMTVAAGRAARAGVYVKTEGALQELTSVDVFVLDKTGTLTEGRPAMIDRFGEKKAIAIGAALEQHSKHPLARAYVAAIAPVDAAVTDVRTETGCGLAGRVGDHDVVVGKPSWVATHCSEMPPGLASRVETYAEAGQTPVAVAVDGSVCAVLSFGDRLRPSAPGFVQHVQKRGASVHLLSGDHPRVAAAAGAALGLPSDAVHGGMSPEQKRDFVLRMQDEGHKVAMLGDGVNDAAALKTANVGIAVGGGASASYAAADVFLMKEGLSPVRSLLDGADTSMRTVHRNLAFSLLYNVVGAAAAIAGFVTPLLAAVAMPMSSLAVVVSSIFQRSFARG